jgi:hypothetical protein
MGRGNLTDEQWEGPSTGRGAGSTTAHALTQRHLDLKNNFYAQVRARGHMPDSEVRLRKQIAKPKELHQDDGNELEQLQTDVDQLVRAVNQLTAENRQLRIAVSQPVSPIRALPTQPHPSRTP